MLLRPSFEDVDVLDQSSGVDLLLHGEVVVTARSPCFKLQVVSFFGHLERLRRIHRSDRSRTMESNVAYFGGECRVQSQQVDVEAAEKGSVNHSYNVLAD